MSDTVEDFALAKDIGERKEYLTNLSIGELIEITDYEAEEKAYKDLLIDFILENDLDSKFYK